MEEPIDLLAKRIDRLELHNLCLKVAVVVVAVIASFSVVMVFGEPIEDTETARVIDAEQLYIRDLEGRMRAVFLVGEDGPNLGLFDSNERIRTAFGVQADKPRLVFYDPDGAVVWEVPPAAEPVPGES